MFISPRSTSSHSPATSSWLPLAIEVDGGDRQAEVVELGEVTGAEVLPPPWGVHRLPAELLEEQENQPMDSEHRPWALVAHNLSTCVFSYEYAQISRGLISIWVRLVNHTIVSDDIPKETPVVAGISVTSLQYQIKDYHIMIEESKSSLHFFYLNCNWSCVWTLKWIVVHVTN